MGEELEMLSRRKSFAIALSRDMVPTARVVVYYLSGQPEEIDPWDIQAGFDVEQHVGVDLGTAGRGRQGDVTVTGGVEPSGHHGDRWGGGVCLPACLNNRKHRSTIYVYNLHVHITPQTL